MKVWLWVVSRKLGRDAYSIDKSLEEFCGKGRKDTE